ncbi:MAG TPA: single-stranded DNA-binding protein [Patescibacteria group bacterium]|nr:single-stranded DNA-binding protein [Patescibacteria group bacterium]
MMLNLNRAMVLGNATRDAEMRYTPNGQAVANFAVATNRRWKNQAGEMQEAVEYHEITVWGKLGEIANTIIKKGTKVYVEGRLQTRSWEAQDGSRRQRTEIVAENIIALSPRGEVSGDYGDSATASSPAAEPASAPAPTAPKTEESKTEDKPEKDKETKKSDAADEGEINLDDIPF